MADLAASGVTVLWEYTYGDGTGKKLGTIKKVEVVLSSMGTDANDISASALGMGEIYRSSPWIKSDDSVEVVASVNYAGTKILLKGAGDNAPADYSGTFRAIIEGRNS